MIVSYMLICFLTHYIDKIQAYYIHKDKCTIRWMTQYFILIQNTYITSSPHITHSTIIYTLHTIFIILYLYTKLYEWKIIYNLCFILMLCSMHPYTYYMLYKFILYIFMGYMFMEARLERHIHSFSFFLLFFFIFIISYYILVNCCWGCVKWRGK